MKHSDAREYLAGIVKYNIEAAERNSSTNDYIVPFFIGDPGVGKTAIPKTVAAEVGIPYFQTIVAQHDAGVMAGLPFLGEKKIPLFNKDGAPIKDDDGNLVFEIEPRMIQVRPSYLPDIHDPEQLIGIYNLDEMPQAFLANLNICSQLVNEWRVGDHKISRGITICATGNKPENKAGTTTLPGHLKDRLNFIEITTDIDDTLEHFAHIGVDFRVRAYLKNNPQNLHKYDVGANSYPTPRSWEKLSAILAMGLKQHIRTDAIAGQIGAGIGTEFETWIRIEDKMPKLEDVINHPEDAPVFTSSQSDILYLLLMALADATTTANMKNVLKYIRRLPNQEWAAVWSKDVTRRDKSLLQTKEMTEWKMREGAKLVL